MKLDETQNMLEVNSEETTFDKMSAAHSGWE